MALQPAAHRDGPSSRWPELNVDAAAFAEFARHRASTARPHEDLHVVCAIEQNNRAAVAAFIQEISSVARRVTRSDGDVATELASQLREKLLGPSHKLREYKGEGSLTGWLRMVAIRTFLDSTRAARRRPDHALGEEILADAAAAEDGPELDYLKANCRSLVRSAFAAAAATLPAHQRVLLAQHYLQALTLEDLGRLYQVHRITMARRVSAARSALAEATRQEISARSTFTNAETRDVIALVLSKLEVSLSSWNVANT